MNFTEISSDLTLLINEGVRKSVFPNIPVPKKATSLAVEDFRTKSIQVTFYKQFEMEKSLVKI